MDDFSRWTNRDGYELEPCGYNDKYERIYNVFTDSMPPLWLDDDGFTLWEMPESRRTNLGSTPHFLRGFNAFNQSRNEPEYIYHDGGWENGGLWCWRHGVRMWVQLTRGQMNRILQSMIRSRGGYIAQYPIRLGVGGGNFGRTIKELFT